MVGSSARRKIKEGIIRLTGGQLLNLAALIHGQPTAYPDKGPGRWLQIRPDDTFIVSYPRSGNTWLRFLVANLVFRRDTTDYANIENRIPDIYVTSELRLRAMAGPRILKSHEAFDPRYRKVIYAVRDPRKVIISQFTTMQRIRPDLSGESFEHFVDRHLDGEFDSGFGSWSANVNGWIHQDKADVDMLVLKYEDMRRDTLATADQVARFLGLTVSDEDKRKAVENSSRQRMEELYTRSGPQLEKAVGEWSAGLLRPNVGSADPGMTPAIERRIRDRYGIVMDTLGYA